MRDHHDRAGKSSQEILKPSRGLRVEVVRGFVEQEEIGLRGKGAAKRDAAFFSTRERADQGV